MKKFRTSVFDPDYLHLVNWLVQAREESGLTQRELAERLGVVRSLVAKVEKGERRLDFIEFVQYSKALNKHPDDLVTYYWNR